jgi:serine/threonine protein kinase
VSDQLFSAAVTPSHFLQLLLYDGRNPFYRVPKNSEVRKPPFFDFCQFAGDAGRMTRFEREAQVLASLNHPNIASIYGLEESCATLSLVMELVDGPTLAERIKGGPWKKHCPLRSRSPRHSSLPMRKGSFIAT